jgi:predicted peroxiredoxin
MISPNVGVGEMAKFLIHVTYGIENPSKAALASLVAKTALDEGHSVDLFLAGDATQLLRPVVIENLSGIGTGSLKAHVQAIVNNGGNFTCPDCPRSREVWKRTAWAACQLNAPCRPPSSS